MPVILSPVVQPVFALDPAQSASGQAAILTLLLLALIAKVVLQIAVRPLRRSALRVLDVIIAPLLIAFVVIVIQRFRDLS
jgi:hypothetical protein